MAQHAEATDSWTAERVARRLADPDLGAQLARLGFRPDDLADAVAQLPTLSHLEHALVATSANRLEQRIGRVGEPEDPDAVSPFAGCADQPDRPRGLLPMAALVLTADAVRAYHAGRNIGAEDSEGGLRDLGQQVWVHRMTFGEFGLHTQWWLTVAWSGVLFWLGRLQFNLQLEQGRWMVSTHIPQSGPLTPASVDDSFDRARRFFAAHFADRPASAFFCHSWLLDPQLVEVLPAQSNMVRFQQRWSDVRVAGSGDADALFFVFRRRYDWDVDGGPDLQLDTLAYTTTLERAIVDRLRTGGHWRVCTGLIGVSVGSEA